MGKGGELWDDSALVDAFDHAVATYKVRARPSPPSDPPCVSLLRIRGMARRSPLGFRVLVALRRRIGLDLLEPVGVLVWCAGVGGWGLERGGWVHLGRISVTIGVCTA
jgi:hypothetical protein